MFDFIASIGFDSLLLIGLAIFGGTIGAALFQKLKIPQVIGYIAIGILLGKTGLKIIDQKTIETFSSLTVLALGFIGFQVGGELEGSGLKRHGRQITGILLGEGLLTFVVVALFTGGATWFLSGNIFFALAAGLIFGAIASATDPASTMDVLWEYRSAGILTTTLTAIVALDDILAMTLYGISSGLAQIFTGGDFRIIDMAAHLGVELFAAAAAGVAGGLVLVLILRKTRKKERMPAFAVGMLLLIIGIARFFHMDVIFAAMAMGITVRNFAKEKSRELFQFMHRLSSPLFILFFVLVGARIQIASMPWWIWMLTGLLCAGRYIGKITGARLGARAVKADMVLRKYTGLGLSAQGGIAIGLAVMAGQALTGTMINGMSLADIIIFTVTTTTLIFQISGPPFIKLASRLSNELGKNITKEDIIEKWKVSNVVTGPTPTFFEGDTLGTVIHTFSENDYHVFPVVGRDGKFAGTIDFEDIKNILTTQEMWEWLVVSDILHEDIHTVPRDMDLGEAMELMSYLQTDQLAVLDNENKPAGILDSRETNIAIEREIIAIKGERG